MQIIDNSSPEKKGYVSSSGFTLDPFQARQWSDCRLSLGRHVDSYQFRRFTSPGLTKKLALERIVDLRRKNNYLRLWYSGGKDSQLILDTAIRAGVVIDEIVLAWFGYADHKNLHPELSPTYEIEFAAIPYLEKIKSSIPHTKISVMRYDQSVYEHVFAQSDWHRRALNWFMCCQNAHDIFYGLIQPEFHFLEDIDDRCDLIGGTTPEIWWDQELQKWACCYCDMQLLNSVGATTEDFLLGTHDCRLLEAHINSIIDSYEAHGLRPSRFEKITSLDTAVDGHRTVRDCSELYDFDLSFSVSTPKSIPKELPIPFDHYLWNQNTAKGYWMIINMLAQPRPPRCLDLYVNHTNWEEIKQLSDAGGMLSRIWTMC